MEKLIGCFVLSCALVPQRANAHDFPTAFEALFQSGRPERLVVALRPGLALTEDGGENWDFSCGEVMGLAGNDRYAAQLTPDGHLLISAFTGLYRDDGMGCRWDALHNMGLPPGELVALDLLEDGSIRALTALPGVDNGLFISRDQGLHWSATGSPLMAARPNRLAAAPSDPNRLYVSGTRADGMAALWVSSDGGEHWSEKLQPGSFALEVLAVDPANAERVFVVRRAPERMPVPDALGVSADGGATFDALFELMQLGGLALTPDGTTLWIGSQAGGLYRADNGRAPELIHDTLHVGCLEYRGTLLWACGRDQSGGHDPFALGSSADRGATWQPRLRSDQLRRLRTCGNPQQASTCSSEWNQWKWDVFGSTSEPPQLARAAGAAADAGAIEPAPEPAAAMETQVAAPAGTNMPSAPSGCALAPNRRCGWSWLWFAVALFPRRRKRRPACSTATRSPAT